MQRNSKQAEIARRLAIRRAFEKDCTAMEYKVLLALIALVTLFGRTDDRVGTRQIVDWIYAHELGKPEQVRTGYRRDAVGAALRSLDQKGVITYTKGVGHTARGLVVFPLNTGHTDPYSDPPNTGRDDPRSPSNTGQKRAEHGSNDTLNTGQNAAEHGSPRGHSEALPKEESRGRPSEPSRSAPDRRLEAAPGRTPLEQAIERLATTWTNPALIDNGWVIGDHTMPAVHLERQAAAVAEVLEQLAPGKADEITARCNQNADDEPDYDPNEPITPADLLHYRTTFTEWATLTGHHDDEELRAQLATLSEPKAWALADHAPDHWTKWTTEANETLEKLWSALGGDFQEGTISDEGNRYIADLVRFWQTTPRRRPRDVLTAGRQMFKQLRAAG